MSKCSPASKAKRVRMKMLRPKMSVVPKMTTHAQMNKFTVCAENDRACALLCPKCPGTAILVNLGIIMPKMSRGRHLGHYDKLYLKNCLGHFGHAEIVPGRHILDNLGRFMSKLSGTFWICRNCPRSAILGNLGIFVSKNSWAFWVCRKYPGSPTWTKIWSNSAEIYIQTIWASRNCQGTDIFSFDILRSMFLLAVLDMGAVIKYIPHGVCCNFYSPFPQSYLTPRRGSIQIPHGVPEWKMWFLGVLAFLLPILAVSCPNFDISEIFYSAFLKI